MYWLQICFAVFVQETIVSKMFLSCFNFRIYLLLFLLINAIELMEIKIQLEHASAARLDFLNCSLDGCPIKATTA